MIRTFFPISKYKDGQWIFIKDFEGSHEDALACAAELQKKDPEYQYRIWDDRE